MLSAMSSSSKIMRPPGSSLQQVDCYCSVSSIQALYYSLCVSPRRESRQLLGEEHDSRLRRVRTSFSLYLHLSCWVGPMRVSALANPCAAFRPVFSPHW